MESALEMCIHITMSLRAIQIDAQLPFYLYIFVCTWQAVVLVVMFVEAVTVMARQESHIRVTRALRPIFLLDVHYCRGVRRYIYSVGWKLWVM